MTAPRAPLTADQIEARLADLVSEIRRLGPEVLLSVSQHAIPEDRRVDCAVQIADLVSELQAARTVLLGPS